MNKNLERNVAICSLVVICVSILLAAFLALPKEPLPVSPLESTIAKMPVGISVDEVNALIGSPPDSIKEEQAVLVNVNAMYSADNPKGKQYGKPAVYEFREWQIDDVNATVALDAKGNVAARWTYRVRDR